LGLVLTFNGKDKYRRVGLAYVDYDGWHETGVDEDVTVDIVR
jgi:hypothetical protein